MFDKFGKPILGLVACVLLPVVAFGLFVAARYAFANMASFFGAAVLIVVAAAAFSRKNLPPNVTLRPRSLVFFTLFAVVLLTAGVTKTLREDAAKAEAKVAQEQKLVADYEAKARLFLAETQLVRSRAMQYRGSSRLSEVGSQECGSAIRKADAISPNRHEASFRAWYYAWYMCATYAGDINSVPSLSDYEKTRPNLKDLLG
ncbi:hypothetical protein N7373_20275 [Achromobacter mucicolens]|uniref:hypothetical protein n=1 Tax=Achromobacter mucicolens TaxID=1389922 RepID=UPI0024493671|nr:hypothetical protein [Achromobacter mucicolens]MDH0093792.1 hypothetical protein [Achromobacter mucicolens]